MWYNKGEDTGNCVWYVYWFYLFKGVERMNKNFCFGNPRCKYLEIWHRGQETLYMCKGLDFCSNVDESECYKCKEAENNEES